MKYNFVSKQELFKIILVNYFNIIADNICSYKNNLVFNDHSALISIKFEDILYIYSQNNKNIIKTINNEISVSKSLDFLLSRLPKNFVRSHRACIVNIKKIIYIKNKIIFSNGEEINLLSRTYKNIVIESYKNIHNISGD